MKTIIIKENQEDTLIREYLDKEYMKPLYDYMKNGQRYSDAGYLNLSPRMVLPFFDWLTSDADEEDCVIVSKALKNNPQLKNKIRLVPSHRWSSDGWEVRCFSQKMEGLVEVPPRKFLQSNQTHLFRILDWDNNIAPILDKFMVYINSDEGETQLRWNQDLEADTVLMNPEIKKTQWLIHFTQNEDDALDIVRNGFKYGLSTKQMSKLGYTHNNLDKDDKNGKYTYAYNAQEIADDFFPCRLTAKSEGDWIMSNTFDQKVWEMAAHYCVMFQASGVELHHHTDKQQQVIFNTDMAHDFVLLTFKWVNDRADSRNTREYQGKLNGNLIWNVCTINGDTVYKDKSLKNVIKWVMNNYDQYRKQIGWSHAIKENIQIHKGEKGKEMSTQGKWADSVTCPHCGEKAYFTMSISDGNRGRGKIKITDEFGKEVDTEVQTIGLYYCPQCHKFIAHNNMA